MPDRNFGSSIALFSRRLLICLLSIAITVFMVSWSLLLRSDGRFRFVDHNFLPYSKYIANGPRNDAFSVGLEGDGSLKVFMYDLPSEFHFELLDWKPEGKFVWPDIRSKVPEYPGGLNVQHSVAYWLTLDLLASDYDNVGGRTAIRDLLGLKKPKISKRKHSTTRSKPKDTLRFYRKRLGFKKPSKVLVDGSVLFFLTINKLSLKDVKEVLKDDKAKVFTTHCVLREMEYFYQKYPASSQMFESIERAKALDVLPCMHQKEISAEQCIRSFVGITNSRKLFVAVIADCSWPLVLKDPTIPIIIADKGMFGLKQLSNREQRLAKKWYADYPIEKATITNKDLNKSPNFRRLRSRIKFYGCVGKIAVDEGGNGQFKAISELLRPLVVPYEKVRENVVNQLLSFPKLYQGFVDLEDPEADVHLAYLEYVNSVSRDGEWGDEYTMQAAADFFQVMFVVITSLEGCAVNEFLPYDMVNVDPEKVLYLSCLYENDEKHYNILHRKSTIASTCRLTYTVTEEQGYQPGRNKKNCLDCGLNAIGLKSSLNIVGLSKPILSGLDCSLNLINDHLARVGVLEGVKDTISWRCLVTAPPVKLYDAHKIYLNADFLTYLLVQIFLFSTDAKQCDQNFKVEERDSEQSDQIKRSRIKKPKTRDTLKFYRNQLGFEKPSTVLIDGSVLFYLTSRGLTIEAIRNLIDDSDAKPITTECVLREMEYFSERYPKSVSDLHRSIGLANMLDVESCMHEKEVNAEKCIRSFVGINNTRKIFVATTVNDYWPLVNKNPMIPIVTVDNGSLVLKQRSNKEQNLTIKKWCVEYPIQQPDGITKKDLKKSPSYKRLKGR
ncbi:exostosin-like protein [Artemisia annua]|uniref:Exostosin-like protein n=1 Tax=Artemisia annua TaxID=35608 RepID=A0A2U1LNA3_ARTAN|nr:exostosin-like protein [Artemisia annua]